ncbi:MAG: hypothetical protein JXQ73_21740 [Phycisphaerae bacterium]|nr:hypothetical protein [Phycisphaerae bacterium]
MTRASHHNSLAAQIASAVRGPTALREDIADEIADHLASHAEDNPHNDATTAEADALRAFGDADQIARELRRVHLGDWIMFQKVMIAALVVIVIGMAASSYFSMSNSHAMWSAMQATSSQLAETNRQTSAQLAELSKRFALLSDMQQMNRPPTMRIFCYTLPGEKPSPDYELKVESLGAGKEKQGELFGNTYVTDAQGRIDTGPLPLAIYMLSGQAARSDPNAVTGEWSQVVRLQQSGADKEVRLCVGCDVTYQFRVKPPEDVTWDLKAMDPIAVYLGGKAGPVVLGKSQRSWRAREKVVLSLTSATPVRGLLPGTSQGALYFHYQPAPTTGTDLDFASTGASATIDVPDKDTNVIVPLVAGKSRLTGQVYDGSPDKPVADVGIDVVNAREWCFPERLDLSKVGDVFIEKLRTDAKGRFGALLADSGSTIQLHWKTCDGKTASLMEQVTHLSPTEASCPIDVAKLSTVCFTFTGMERLREQGMVMPLPPVVSWERRTPPLKPTESLWRFGNSGMVLTETAEDQAVATALLFEGEYEFMPRVAAWRHDNSSLKMVHRMSLQNLIRNSNPKGQENRLNMYVAAGRRYEVNFAMQDLFRLPHVHGGEEPLQIAGVKLFRSTRSEESTEEISPPTLPAGKQTDAVVVCAVKNLSWTPSDGRYRAELALDMSLIDAKGKSVLEVRDDRLSHYAPKSPRVPGRQPASRPTGQTSISKPMTFPAGLPAGAYTLKITLKDKLSARSVDFALEGVTIAAQP